jgi:hypothetical protein
MQRKKDEEVEFERWGQDHDKVLIITLNGLIDPALGWELYQVFCVDVQSFPRPFP